MSVQIAQFDDPINPQGWAQEPLFRRLRCEFPKIEWSYHPTVLVRSWEEYDGPEIENGRQGMPATCATVSEQSGMPIDEYLWFDDPPSSSTAACRAIAAVSEQEETAAVRLLRALREATFIRRTNVSDREQLESVIDAVPEFDSEAVTDALEREVEDRLTAHEKQASAVDAPGVIRTNGSRLTLPTLVVSDEKGDEERGLSGRHEFERYLELVREVSGQEPQRNTLSVREVIERFSSAGWISTTELAELADLPYQDAREIATEASDDAVERTFASESFFRDPAFVGETD